MDAPPSPSEPTVPALSGWGRSSVLWLAVSLSMLVLVGVAAWVVVSDSGAPRPPFLAEHARASKRSVPTESSDGLRLAGSGSNLPMARALSATFTAGASHHPVVHASIGSGGGVRALLDGVIDIALVSRPLREAEREQGLVATPYARVPIVVAAHASVPTIDLRRDELVEIYSGRRDRWSDGSRIVVLQRERGDSSHSAVARVVAGFGEANEAAYKESRWRVLYRDDAMREALADTRGAIGLFGQGALPKGSPVQALSIDGVRPSVQTVRDGTYPFAKDFWFVTRGPPIGDAAAFIDFAASQEGQRIIESTGGVPLLPSRDEPTEPASP